jgi:DNA-binding XRE family transcriptional regulator
MEEIEARNTHLKKDYKTPLKEILSASSIAYLLSPFRSKRFLIKIIWSLFVLIFLFLSIYYVILNIIDYLKYETTTSIQTIYEQESEFPTISICSKIDTNFEIKILDIWFNNENLTIEWKNHIEQYNDAFYGKCYRFNSGLNWTNHSIEIKKSKRIGSDDGLWLTLYTNTTYDFGELKILFHNYTENPINIFRKGSIIPSGTNNYFLIKRTLDQKLESPFNECLKDINQFAFNKTIIDYLNKKNRKYSQFECLNICFNTNYNQTNPCDCYLTSLDEEPYFKCENNNSCYEKFNKIFKQTEMCSQLCPLECDQYSYEIFHTPSKIIGTGQINKFKENDFTYISLPQFKTYENVSKTYYSINAYYEDSKYTLISQQPRIELFGLISNLGGILGLFIGFSFISCLELIEVLAEFIYVYLE